MVEGADQGGIDGGAALAGIGAFGPGDGNAGERAARASAAAQRAAALSKFFPCDAGALHSQSHLFGIDCRLSM